MSVLHLWFNVINNAQLYMMEMVNARRNSEKKEERYDLFSSLLDASEEESDSQSKLTDRELLGEPAVLRSFTTTC